ncbi:sigma 54-interacting transcriptional regulator [Hyalangium sp.]|uniref:sigma 54-interacting transcriptional regulator n=1 Tax=Hyalangium sp. TaxID=2028555 RepID=UPI002D61E2E6|nr:sigma 54-interacting transcriptional regulator [Hyalangium sp.]HYH99351.1 sigma 54-interacting transcriptional regulator [Hyalangium sp.]
MEGLLVRAYPPALRLRVALISNPAGNKVTRLLSPDKPLIVGRAPEAGLRIDDPTLSREHARFLLSGSRVLVEDLGSKNGIFFAGSRVARVELTIGDEIVLGGVALQVQALGANGDSLGIIREELIRHHLEEELTRARQFRRPFALLLVRVRSPGGTPAPVPEDGAWIEAVRSHLRPVDPMALYGSSALEVLLPETGAEEAHRIARAMRASGAGGGRQLLVGLALYPASGGTADELFEAAREAAHRASPGHPVESNPAGLPAREQGPEGALIAGQAMRPVLETVASVATSRIPVIFHGETGTGKEVLAQLIHESGPRKGRRIVRVNCGAIPKDLVESTLFGHERGAFTGALQQQKGVFEEADGGTVFLDEIGELPPAAQASLLRVLEVGAFNRVGSNREIQVDVRIVAATHRDLEAMAEEGTFRSDLYYRLSGVVIEIPPLRERQDEIEPLARRFLHAANKANGRRAEGLSPEALALLKAYSWPGNVRELRNVIERAVVVTQGALIGSEDLPARVRTGGRSPEAGASKASAPGAPESEQAREKVHQFEARMLQEALAATGWNRAEAARKLGMPVRTLSYRLKVLGVKKPQ